MPAQPTTYASDKVVVVVQGTVLVGFAADSVVKVTRDKDAFTKYVGADGSVSRARNADRTGSIEVVLAQTSPSNDYLSGLANQDELFGTGIGPSMVQDTSGRTIHSSQVSWVKKQPENELASEIKTRTWIIDTGTLNMNTAGN